MITQERLKQRYHYNKRTGVFTRLFNRGAGVAGTIVSIPDSASGHLRVRIDGKKYPLTNLAWLYVYGVYYEGMLDHKDGDEQNNRIKNLRPASYSQNAFNCPIRHDNKTGAKGVVFVSDGRYRARITAFKKVHHLGYFKTLKAAASARRAAAERLHGEFARAA